jgi:hypothetical protein
MGGNVFQGDKNINMKVIDLLKVKGKIRLFKKATFLEMSNRIGQGEAGCEGVGWAQLAQDRIH